MEFYFSDANISKDVFLHKHACRGKQGFVSLKLITSLQKMKSITHDYHIVAYSLRSSDKLVVNEEGTKVRRVDPLPKFKAKTSHTVLAVNLPFENPSVGLVADLFLKCGEIALIRILRPGGRIPGDVNEFSSKHPELKHSVCTVIEFESSESAQKAVDTMQDTENWRTGLRVSFLEGKKKGEKKKRKGNKNKCKEDAASSDTSASAGGVENPEMLHKHKNSRLNELACKHKNKVYNSSSDTESGDKSSHITQIRAKSAGKVCNAHASLISKSNVANRSIPNVSSKSNPSSPRGSPRGSPTSYHKQHSRSPLVAGISPNHSPKVSPERRKRNLSGTINTDSAGERPTSPWVQRRLKAREGSLETSGVIATSPRHSPLMARHLLDGSLQHGTLSRRMANIGVARQPFGPDGTKGFHVGNNTNSFESINP